MVADALQDMFRDRKKLREMNEKRDDKPYEESKPDLFEEYLLTVDIHLVERGLAFKPSKSVEYGKTDQSMINHIRNGILFLLRFNEALEKLNARPLDKNGLRECISLFVVHDLHKLKFEEWKLDEDNLELPDTMENEFEIPEILLKRFIEEMHLRDFAPGLKDEDYFSVAVALHKSRFSRSGARTSHFMDLEPFLYLMDNMASCASPEEAVSARSLTALRDGFPQDSPEAQLNLQYHKLDDVKGILSGIINKSVADVLQEQGLVMLMAYQDGCVYLSKGGQKAKFSEDLVGAIYKALENSIHSQSALSDATSLSKRVELQGNINCYRLSDEYYFFSGPRKMISAFLDRALTSARMQKKSKMSDDMLNSIRRALEAAQLNIEQSDQEKRSLVEYARLINSIHKSFVSKMIKDNKQALLKTCEIWGIPENVTTSLSNVSDELAKEFVSGGKWEYSYAVAQSVMNVDFKGFKLKELSPTDASEILFEKVWVGLVGIDEWDDFVSGKTSIYRDELVEYLHDTLSINGMISQDYESKLSDSFKEYQKGGRGGKLCNLCNRGTLLESQDDMKNVNSFLKFNFSNRVFLGKGKPENIYACIPCSVELVLRLNGSDLPKSTQDDVIYYHFIPDYFYTPESWDLIHTILSKFSGAEKVRMAALANKVFNLKYIEKSGEVDINSNIYDTWIEVLAEKDNEKGSKGMSMTQYMAQGYPNIIGNACMIFYKPHDNNTEFHFFGVFIALIIAAYTGMRVVISHSPITTMRGRDFNEVVALDSINSHVMDFYGKFIPLSRLEATLKSASALIRLGNNSSGLKDSLFPKYL
jgi:CRISPR-associated protein Csc3